MPEPLEKIIGQKGKDWMGWKNTLNHWKDEGIKILVKKAVKEYVKKMSKKYGADAVIKKLKVEPASTTLCIRLEADAVLGREGIIKFFEKIG